MVRTTFISELVKDTVSLCSSALKAFCIFKCLKVLFEPGFLVVLSGLWAHVP